VPLAVTFHALGLVRREHQGRADAFPDERIKIERRLVREADRLVAECPQDQDDLMRLYAADPARIVSVPCGVDTQLFTPGDRAQARRALGWDDDEFIVLQLGRLVPRKGIDNVIQALAKLPRHLRARLVVVGGDAREADEHATPEIARLRRIAQEAGVADQVTFTGHRRRDELRAFYVAANVFVTTPWYEPFGITPLEAMACGTPVVGSAVGGIRHSVAPGISGYLVPPRDPEALAARLVALYERPALARSLGHGGVVRVRSLFTWERVADDLIDVYRQLVHARRRRSLVPLLQGMTALHAGLTAAPLHAGALPSVAPLAVGRLP
jgi:D-inositol-3-phosphate glycosyltransferase